MQDRVPKYPGRVKLVPVSGQENTFDMVRADDPTQIGDSLNKATLLRDFSASLFGLDENAVPDDVFAFLGKYNQHWWKRQASGAVSYVYSSDRNAYPDSGISDGYEYKYLGIPFENAVSASRVAVVSYVGTGAYGSGKPNILTLDFAPKYLVLGAWFGSGKLGHTVNDSTPHLIPTNALSTSYVPFGGYSNAYFKKSADGKTITWYGTSETYQLNFTGSTYYVLAIG